MVDKECGPGWDKIVDPLIARCKCEGVEILQVKEKFGALRFYVNSTDHDLMTAIDHAELESCRTCEECGEPGSRCSKNGWLKTLCKLHKEAAGAE